MRSEPLHQDRHVKARRRCGQTEQQGAAKLKRCVSSRMQASVQARMLRGGLSDGLTQLAAAQINLGSVALHGLPGLIHMQRVSGSDLPADTSWAITQSCSWEGGGVSLALVSVTLQHLTRCTDELAAAVGQTECHSCPCQ